MGSGMMSEKTFTIGVLMGNVHSPYTVQLLRGMAEAAKEEKVNVIYFLGTHTSYLLSSMLGHDNEINYDYQFNTIYDYANLGQLDALIVSYGSLVIFLEERNRDLFLNHFKNIPYLLLEDEEKGEDKNFMIADNYKEMYRLSEHLVRDHKYKRIVYISGPKGNKDALERFDALKDACAKYDVTIPDDAIEYGDYSEYADEQVKRLLNRYPDAQAIVCANDEMAYAGYRVCRERGLRIGKDIAITGFDNNVRAEVLEPPITTVENRAFNMGYSAILNSLKLCRGGQVGGIRVASRFIKRESCGCITTNQTIADNGSVLNDEADLQTLVEKITDNIIKSTMNREIHEQCKICVYELILQVKRLSASPNKTVAEEISSAIINIVKQLTSRRIGKYISLISLSNEIVMLFARFTGCTEGPDIRLELMTCLSTVQKKIQTHTALIRDNEITAFHRKSWYVQMIAREMTENIDDEVEFFLSAIKKLKLLDVKSSYIFLLDEARIHREGDEWICPEHLHLAAYHSGTDAISFNPKDRPVASDGHGLSKFLRNSGGHQLYAFILFSGERQYGLLLCEMNPEDSSVIYFTSLQIGTALRFLELRKVEVEIRSQLEESIQIINAKNEVLNFISEYDELTHLLNRRGFMERVMTVNQSPQYAGRKAIFVFADLDHLKEINDRFGHGEGDYAIKKSGETLKESLHCESILGRIGGDEFVAMVMAEHYPSLEDLKKGIKGAFDAENDISGKPYYIEMSLGYAEFICGQEHDLSAIIKKADDYLYSDKEKRRASIAKA